MINEYQNYRRFSWDKTPMGLECLDTMLKETAGRSCEILKPGANLNVDKPGRRMLDAVCTDDVQGNAGKIPRGGGVFFHLILLRLA